MDLPFVDLAVSRSGRVGIALANYTSQLSRMWAWDVADLSVLGYQDVKGRAWLSDLSGDGEHVAWGIEKKGGLISYIGVSRPPYFHALLLANMSHIYGASLAFVDDKVYVKRKGVLALLEWQRPVPERVVDGSPYRVMDDNGDIGDRPRLSELFAAFFTTDDSRPRISSWFPGRHWHLNFTDGLVDSVGRSIRTDGRHVYADKKPFLDLARQPFTEVVPPEWAKSWTAPRPK